MSRVYPQTLASQFISNTLIVILCAGLIACRQAVPTDAIRFGLASAPVTLDPRYATDAISSRINRLIYRRLVDFDDSSRPVPSLASWQKLSDIHYRFVLLEQWRSFHDGTPLTAEDVKATFDYILKEANASPHRSTLDMIESIAVLDSNTVDFHLKYPDPMFPGYLEIGILPAAKISAGHPFNRHPVGSGPFRFVQWLDQGHVQLERLRDRQLFEFLSIEDENTRVLKLLRGEIDMLQNDIGAEMIRYLEGKQQVTVTTARGSNFSYLGFNLQDDVVGQQLVREAIAYAIDRQAIIKYIFAGRARPAAALLTPDHWAGHPGLAGYSYAPELARKRLTQLGYNRENPLTVTYKTSNNPFRLRLATIIQSQLAEAGIRVQLRSYDWGTFYGDIKAGNFQMYSLAWVGINLPDIFRQVFHSDSVPPVGANRGRYANPEVDELLTMAQSEQDPVHQASLYRRIQEILLQTLPYVPLWYEDHVLVTGIAMKGYEMHSDGNYDGLINVYRTENQPLAHNAISHE